ncbi:hypothetical protein HDU67_004990 [Dinochytrium kinnereticum]|nr:hypothetical protein HDU67_004990 [Dinochytrium kinnereticum]
MVKNGGPRIWTLVSGDTSATTAIDVVGFDPRGIGASHPVICFDSSFSHAAFETTLKNVGVPGYPGSMTSLEGFAAFQKARGESCRVHDERRGGFLKFVSTASTARDMDLIREALGEEVLNFYGFSYGTFLGATYVNMFPDRVGRIAIDGVVNPQDFVTTKSDMMANSLLHVEEILDQFGSLCESAGPTRCALSPPTPSPNLNITSKLIRRAIARLAVHPIPVHDLPVPTIVTAETLSNLLMSAVYAPARWPLVAQAVAAIHPEVGERDESPHPSHADARLLAVMTGSPLVDEDAEDGVCKLPEVDTSGAEGFPAVYCNDSEDEREVPVEVWEEWAKRVDRVSPIGRLFYYHTGFACKYWPVRPVERYVGPWNKKLKNKILILGNTLDPVTPLESAKILTNLMEGNAVLLTHDGIGHCTTSQPGLCTIQHIRNHFQHGVLPPDGVVCGNDSPAFPGAERGLGGGEEGILESVRRVGEVVLESRRRSRV